MGKSFISKRRLPMGGVSLKMEITPFGNWDKTIRTIQTLGPNIKKASLKAQLKVCNEIARTVKSHLRNQDLGWKKLSPDYMERKAEAGLHEKILMAHGTYYNSIEVWQKGNQHMVFVGVKRGIYTRSINGKRSKLDVATIAVIHEFSSGRRFPRRPLWNPSIAEIGGAKGIKKMYVASLKYWLRAYGVPVQSTLSSLGWR